MNKEDKAKIGYIIISILLAIWGWVSSFILFGFKGTLTFGIGWLAVIVYFTLATMLDKKLGIKND